MKKIYLLLAVTVLCSFTTMKFASDQKENVITSDVCEENTYHNYAVVTVTVANYKKYEIKSGIVTFEDNMEMAGMKISKKRVLYFDNFGLKECEEIYNVDASGKETLEKRTFVKDGFNYACSVEYGSGSKTKAQGYGTALRFSVKDAEALKNKDFKKNPNETICGKDCEGYFIVTNSGNMDNFGWKGITLKTVVTGKSGKNKNSSIATKLEENATIPADKFEVPKGVVMTDM